MNGHAIGEASLRDRHQRARLVFSSVPETIYAIGDVHGCMEALLRLERKIVEDAAPRAGARLLVYLGDYVDRGPSSAQVLDHLIAPPPAGFERVCIAGNHDEMFLDFVTGEGRNDAFLEKGGRQALASYGIDCEGRSKTELSAAMRARIPAGHINFIADLPSLLSVGNYCFVHAGLDPSLPFEDQTDRVLMWSRPGDFPWPESGPGFTVVHGHTPVERVDLSASRINVDTGAVLTGTLSALRISASGLSVLTSD
ncbi:serine/threonine protein phosphatase [Pseudomonas sp. R2.Fl]|nr:serine/threonine protein phosphatase [Pseudomonas sp. R2.Fl]